MHEIKTWQGLVPSEVSEKELGPFLLPFDSGLTYRCISAIIASILS
jgi:hypothetical protein